jgi:hypothetical protein
MKKLILISFLINLNLFALSSDIKEALAVGVFHEDGTGEKVQHKRITDENYDGTCFSKIVVIGKIENKSIKVRIGESLGYIQNTTHVYNVQNILIGEEITFLHNNVTKGLIEVSIDGRIYDSKVFVK